MKKSVVVGFALLCTVGLTIWTRRAFAQDTVDLLWKARALQAIERIEEFSKKQEASPSETLPLKSKFEMMLEFAYAQIIANHETVVKKSPVGTSYHLVFNFGDDGLLDAFYTYDRGTGQCVSLTIARLPQHHCIGLPASEEGANIVLLMNPDDPNEPALMLHRSNPLLCHVVGGGSQPTDKPSGPAKNRAPATEQSDSGKP